MRLQPVILSGGAGTRLWPLSREAYPKQFLPLVGEATMLQETAARLDGLGEEHPHHGIGVADPLVVCNEDHRFLVAEQLIESGRHARAILLEPEARNTAPALTLAALAATRDGADPVLLAMPADHVIVDSVAFRSAVAEGCLRATEGAVITFGIVPGGPETGYGYIRRGSALDGSSTAFVLDAFVEKPDRDTAEAYVASGDYLWNSGIFMMRAGRWLDLIERYRPELAAACRRAFDGATSDIDFCRVDRDAFRACPSDSIDYAVMEPFSAEAEGQAIVLALDAGWSDVGAWSALWDVSERDGAGNALHGDVFVHEARENLLHAQHRMLAAVGVEGLIVVETPDAVLVLDKDRCQDVKAVTRYLKEARRQECVSHRRVHRPWGAYEPVDQGDRHQVKRLTVKPGASLSLQMHHHRAEHWVVVRGTARVTCDDRVFLLTENQSTYIPLGTRHRLENPGSIPLELIEVQSGGYLGEDDIVRFDDLYNRTTEG
ncbi:MAG: mannose-1-phosphate guanylyltransferase/mannose-6-phosphate isomerase [Chromatiales bacterium]